MDIFLNCSFIYTVEFTFSIGFQHNLNLAHFIQQLNKQYRILCYQSLLRSELQPVNLLVNVDDCIQCIKMPSIDAVDSLHDTVVTRCHHVEFIQVSANFVNLFFCCKHFFICFFSLMRQRGSCNAEYHAANKQTDAQSRNAEHSRA